MTDLMLIHLLLQAQRAEKQAVKIKITNFEGHEQLLNIATVAQSSDKIILNASESVAFTPQDKD